MAKMRKKGDLPSKTCPVCQKPFAWRKKWERDWENVIYCSKRCQSQARSTKHTDQTPSDHQ
jgi:hypothetical protein